VANEPNVCPNVGWVKDFNDGQAIIEVPFNGATITGSPGNNSNWPQRNDPTLNNDLDAARLIIDARASEYGKIDDMITAQPRRSRANGTTNRTSRRRTCSR
jgi:peptide/nickel transport system substrate-binding protein